MRIIGGRWRGRPLVAPKGRDTRPTADRVREAIFSSVYSLLGDLEGRIVIDLYAGSGALGLEALSRGADRCIFVESDGKAASVLAANLSTLGIGKAGATVMQAKVSRGLADRLGSVGASLLLADPPYRIDPLEFSQVLEALATAGVLAQGALVMYEHSSKTEASWPTGFRATSDRRYGDTAVSFAAYEGTSAT